MRVAKGQSRWVPLVHGVRSVGKVLLRMSERDWVPGKSTVTANNCFSLTVDGLRQQR